MLNTITAYKKSRASKLSHNFLFASVLFICFSAIASAESGSIAAGDTLVADLSNGAYISVPGQFDFTNFSITTGQLQFWLNNSQLQWRTATNKTITRIILNNSTDIFSFNASGTDGYLNFSGIMTNASHNYSFYLDDTFQSYTNSDTNKIITVNYTGAWSDHSFRISSTVEPDITSNLNNITGNSTLSFNLNVNNAVLFSAGADQTISTWTWTGATQAGGDGTSNSTATKMFSSTGVQYVSVNGTNANGTTSTLTWTVTVVTGGGGGTDWDWLDGYVKDGSGTLVNTATVTTIKGNAYTNANGYYSFGYVFVDATSYWINITKSGYSSNNTYLLFNEDHEMLNVTLTLTSTPTITMLETLAATNVDTDSATLNAVVTNHTGTEDIWFEYGAISGIYHHRTLSQSITDNGTISYTILNGYPIIPDRTYYYRVAITGEKGNEMSFTTADISELTGFDFDKNWDALKNTGFDVGNLTVVLPLPYTDIMGTLFWGVLFGIIFIVGWIRQGDVTNMALVGILIAGTILAFVPPEFVQVGQALLVVSVAGMLVSYIYKK